MTIIEFLMVATLLGGQWLLWRRLEQMRAILYRVVKAQRAFIPILDRIESRLEKS